MTRSKTRSLFGLAALVVTAGATVAAAPGEVGRGDIGLPAEGGAAMATTITLVPSAPFVLTGGTVDVAVVISGLGNAAAPSLGAFDLKVQFDPARFSFQSVAFGPQLGNLGVPEALTGQTLASPNFGAFEVSLLPAANLLAAQPGTFTLYTVTFKSLSGGTGQFSATVNAIGDQNGNPLVIGPIAPVNVQTGPPDIPTMGTWGLIALIGVLVGSGLVWLRRIPS